MTSEHVLTPYDLLDRFELRDPPVNLSAIARGLGLEVIEVINADWEGAIEPVRSQVFVEVESRVCGRVSIEQARLVLAHEIAHHVCHAGLRFRCQFGADGHQPDGCHGETVFGGEGLDPYRLQANRFALELILPRHWLIAHHRYEQGDVLATRFGVGRHLLDLRLKEVFGSWPRG